jgi:hypothetical protein
MSRRMARTLKRLQGSYMVFYIPYRTSYDLPPTRPYCNAGRKSKTGYGLHVVWIRMSFNVISDNKMIKCDMCNVVVCMCVHDFTAY